MANCSRVRTVDGALNVCLDRRGKDLSLAPDLYNAADLILHIGRRALVGGGGGISDDGLVGSKELLLFADLRRLGYFWACQRIMSRR